MTKYLMKEETFFDNGEIEIPKNAKMVEYREGSYIRWLEPLKETGNER